MDDQFRPRPRPASNADLDHAARLMAEHIEADPLGNHMRRYRRRLMMEELAGIDIRVRRAAYRKVRDELHDICGYELAARNRSGKPSDWSEDFIARILEVVRWSEEAASHLGEPWL